MQQKRISKRYWKAVNSLYGASSHDFSTHVAGSDEKSNGEPKKRVKRDCPKESHEQIVAVSRIKKLGLVVHHSPNGGRRNHIEGARFKQMGVSPGFPDLTFPYARKGFHGLYIEVKPVKGGTLSQVQLEWGQHLIKEGYAWYEARGADEVMSIVYDYFGLKEAI